MNKITLVSLALASLLATSCSGFREANGSFTVHAESFRLFGLAIPSCDQDAAATPTAEKFPNATIVTQVSTPADWTSFWGVLGNIASFNATIISGKK